VYIREGAPGIKVNGKTLEEYFPLETLRDVVKMPLQVTSNEEKLNILINVRGGGINGQAGAIKHGIARALVDLDETNRPSLKANGFLTRDARMVERKKYGQPGARKKFQFSKR
jgi:small subunit ribosomal protein S9